ncbi:MAG TPA: hypothetical protein VFF66_08955, partial [Brevundimonas sp.]|nr:hypothetical protein [Brevundimonas sp.]
MLKSRRRRRSWLLAIVVSVSLHLALLAVVILTRPAAAPFVPPVSAPAPVEVTLFRQPPPVPKQRSEAPVEGGSSAPPSPAEAAPDPPPAPPRPAPPRPAP